MRILCVIPSRMASTRLANKPLVNIQGKPMIQWVYERAAQCPTLTRTIVATDNEFIAKLITELGGEVVMTDPAIKTGSDRVAAVAKQHKNFDVIINLQGDEPFIKPEMLTALVTPYLEGKTPEMTTLACPLESGDYENLAFVKVLTDRNHNALYFSRAPIPYLRVQADLSTLPVYHHQGIYAFRRDFLEIYGNLAQTPLELTESLEQLRTLEHGFKIKVCVTQHKTLEINTPDELILAQEMPL